jgi:hypothetical protein
MAQSDMQRYQHGEDHLQSEHWRLAELQDELAEASKALHKFEFPGRCLPQPNFVIERYNLISKTTSFNRCTAEDCRAWFVQNQAVVRVSGLQQRCLSEPVVEIDLRSCLRQSCLCAPRWSWHWRMPEFNFSFQTKPGDLTDAEALDVTLCTTRPVYGSGPAKRKSEQDQNDADFQEPPKKRLPSGRLPPAKCRREVHAPPHIPQSVVATSNAITCRRPLPIWGTSSLRRGDADAMSPQ